MDDCRTLGGSPIVDGRYLDFDARQIKEVQPGESFTSGPPTIDVYWHNLSTEPSERFLGYRGGFAYGDVGLYVSRLGRFFNQGGCELYSLNATQYSVVVVVITQRNRTEFMQQYHACGLGGPRPSTQVLQGMLETT